MLSATWVQTYQSSETARKLRSSPRPRVIGATFHTSMDREGFGDVPQVLGDVSRRQPSEWVALDDDPTGWPDGARDKLVLSDGLYGLGETRAQMELKATLQTLVSSNTT